MFASKQSSMLLQVVVFSLLKGLLYRFLPKMIIVHFAKIAEFVTGFLEGTYFFYE